ALVYLAGLAYAATALVHRTDTPRARLVLLLSVLGAGLFAYYQGRSHPHVLMLACWPCFLLMALFLAELLAWSAGVRRPLAAVAAGLMAWFLAGSSWSLFAQAEFVRDAVARPFGILADRRPSPVAAEVELLRRHCSPGEEVLLVV